VDKSLANYKGGTMTAAQDAKKAFCGEMAKKYGMAERQVVDLLASSFKTFNKSKVKEYEEAIARHRQARLLAEKEEGCKNMIAKVKRESERPKCPVCGADTYPDPHFRRGVVRPWTPFSKRAEIRAQANDPAWVCSAGGAAHYMINRTSQTTGKPVQKVLEGYKNAKSQRDQREEEEREIWLRNIRG
jgi:hypothetical protein